MRGKSWRVYLNYKGEQRTFTIAEVDAAEASLYKAQTEELLWLLNRKLISVPAGCTIEQFLFYRAKPPEAFPLPERHTIFAKFRDGYLKTIDNGSVGNNTLYTTKIHAAHLAATLGNNFTMNALTHADLPRHINRRSRTKVAAVTIRRELDTLRAA
ncbi:MAG TPA: hypothetical protein VKU02_17810 [Gemmataceae bacterium]|nr:hypothetical protein [Gemmataceae bacterium]